VAFPIEFAGAFIQNKFRSQFSSGYIMRSISKGPFSDLVHQINGFARIASFCTPGDSLGIYQIDISQTKHREVDIHKFMKRTLLPISSYIFPLGDSIPLPEVFNILNFQLLALCKKHSPAIIFLVKFFNKLGGYPVSCPAPVNSKCRSAHIAAYCCMNDKISASKGFSMLTVKSYRENDAVGRMIISKK